MKHANEGTREAPDAILSRCRAAWQGMSAQTLDAEIALEGDSPRGLALRMFKEERG